MGAEELAPGQKLLNEAAGAGYSQDEVQQWKAKKYQSAAEEGYSVAEIQKYFGDDKAPDMAPVKQHFTNAIEEAKPKDAEGRPKPAAKEAQTYLESLEAGLQSSVSGLDLRKAPPDITPNQHGDMVMRILNSLGQVAGDFPAMVVGGAAGGFGGAVAGAVATVNPIGAAIGGVGGAGYGAMALPEALRHWMMDGYEKGEIRDAGDFASRVVSAAWEAHKQGTVGALTAGAGAYVKPIAGPIAALAAEIPTMTIAGAAIQGRTPEPHEFLDAAVMVGGLHAASEGFGSTIPKKFADIFRNTGERPSEVAELMQKDVVLRQEMLSENPNLPAQAERKIEVPSQAEQEKLGLKPIDENGKVQETPPRPPGEPPTTEELQKKFNGYIGEMPDKEKLSFKEKVIQGFNQKYADHLDFTLAQQDMMKELGANPTAEENPEILSRLHADYQSQLQGWVEKSGPRDFHTQEPLNIEPMKKTQERYAQEFPDDPNKEGYKAYGIAARALEKAEQKTSSGKTKEISVGGEKINLDEARQIVEAGKDKYQKYVDARVARGNAALKYAHDSGYWTPEQFKKMIDSNLSYMDFNRIQEEDALTGKKTGGGGGRNVKELFGEGGLFQDPFLSEIKNTDMLLRMAEENNVKKAIVKIAAPVDAEGNPEANAWLREVPNEVRPVKIEAEELNRGLVKQGIQLNDTTLEGLTVFRPPEKRLGPNRMEAWVDGKRKIYEGPSELIASVNALKGNAAVMDIWGQMLKGAANVERFTTVGTPWFAIKHMWRQQLSAGVFSDYGYKPMADWIRTAMDLKNSPSTKAAWNDFFNDGGAVSSLQAFDKTWVESQIYKLDKEVPFMNKVWNKVDNVVQLSHWMIVNHDNIIRFSEQQKALASGASREEAAFAGREVLPDFQKAGLVNSFLFQQTAFLKVHAQGLDRSAQAAKADYMGVKESGINAANNTIRALTWITLPHVLLAAANWGDKDVDQLEGFQRYGYFNAVIPRWQSTTVANAMAVKDLRPDLIRQKEDGTYEYNDKIIARLQNPFTIGVAFGGVADAALKSWQKKDPGEFGTWLKQIGLSTLATPIPNFATAPYAQAINYESFTGRPVVTLAKEKLNPEMQYDQYTSETAKQLGKLIQAIPFVGDVANQIGPAGRKITSPMVLDMYIRETTGSMGQLGVMIIDKALQKAGVSPEKIEPTPTWADYPIIREFVWRHPSMRAEDIVRFQEDYAKASSDAASIKAKAAEASFNPDAGIQVVQMQEKYADEMVKLNGPHEAIKNMAHMIQGLRLLPEMDATQKRQLTDQYYYRMVQLAQDANRQMDEMKKVMKTNMGAKK